MMKLEVYAAYAVVIRKQDGDLYEKLLDYLETKPISTEYPFLSVHEAGVYVVGDEDERNSLVVAISSTVQDFDFFTGHSDNPVHGAFEFSSLDVENVEYRELVKFCQDFEVEKPIDMVVWNFVQS